MTVTLKTTAAAFIEQGKAVMDANGAWIYRNKAEALDRAVGFEITAENCNGIRVMAKTS